MLWFRLWGIGSTREYAFSLDTSAMSKYLYLAGSTTSNTDGTALTSGDALILKLKYDGTFVWGLSEGDTYHDWYQEIQAASDDSFSIACGNICY